MSRWLVHNVIRQAPVPVVHVARRDDGSAVCTPNVAAADWLPACVWTPVEWDVFGGEVLAALARGEADGKVSFSPVRWHASTDEESGCHAWLSGCGPEAAILGTGQIGRLLHEGYVLQEHLALAHSLIGLAFWHTNIAEGRIRANAPGYAASGLSEDITEGLSLEEIRDRIHPEDRDRVVRAHQDALVPGAGPVDAEARYVGPEGYRTLLTRRVAERDATGKAVGMVGVTFDVTQLREAMRRTEEAEEANRAKSQFLANMSHEIRTPMNAILGLARMLMKSELQPQQLNYLVKLDRSARALLGLLNDILDFSKIEAGRMDLERSEFSVDDVLDDLMNLLALQAQEKGLELLLDVPAERPALVLGDPLRLSQVLVNLGNNAVKFTARGEVLVRMEVVERDPVRAMLRFSVTDTGVGIDAETRQRLFQPFAQADSSTTRRFGGTGLGLAISRRIVEMMGGSMTLESTAGQGSTFAFEVPFELPATAAATSPARLLPDWSDVRILVVDDNATARRIIVDAVRSFGMDAVEAHDGYAALARMSQAARDGRAFDLLLLDWQMPGMDGVKCLHELTASGLLGGTEVLMTTGFGRDDVERRLKEARLSVRDVLVKPVTASSLFEACALALGAEARASARAAARDDADEALRRALAGVRLLLVEDNDINREIAVALLHELDIVVAVAEDGRQAIEMLHADDYDGVLMDCQMPTMDGYEATREIRTQARWQRLPVVAMTANAMAGDRELALAAGMNDHISKPIELQELHTKLARWFGRRA